MNKQKEKIGLFFFLMTTIIFLIAGSYYSKPRYVGDTAIFSQIVENIAHTGKAESNIFANTQDCIDRYICGMPVKDMCCPMKRYEEEQNDKEKQVDFLYFI